MKWQWIILLVIASAAVGFLPACAPRVFIPADDPGQPLFDKAEQKFAAGLHDDALESYNDYLALYPDGRHVPAALLKSADILAARNNYPGARRLYQRLIEAFPDTRWAGESQIGILHSWYNEKQYETLLAHADSIKDTQMVSDDLRLSKYNIVADTYLAMGEPLDAAYVITAVFDSLDTGQQEKLMPALKRVAEMVEIETLQSLLTDIKNIDSRGRVVCGIGQRFIEKGDFEWAFRLLSDFTEHFPDNRYVPEAEALLAVIETKAVYDRYAIGCLLPLSGRYGNFGNRALRGIQAAFNEFAAGASPDSADVPLRLVIRDSGADAQQAVQAVRELAEQKVAAIIGPLIFYREAVVEAQKQGIPVITLAQDKNVPLIGDYVFRNFLTPRMQVRSLVTYACREKGWRRLAVLYPDEPYGREFAHAFWDEILLHDAEMVGFESYNPQHTDFAESIKKLVGLYYDIPEDLKEAHRRHIALLEPEPEITADEEDTGDTVLETWLTDTITEQRLDTVDADAEDFSPDAADPDLVEEAIEPVDEKPRAIVDFDALFIPDGPSKVGLIMPQLIFYDVVDTAFLGTNLWHSRDLVEIAGRYARGAIMPAAFWTQDPDEHVRRFVAGFTRIFGEEPDFIAAAAYDTANILFSMVVDPDVRYRSTIKNRLTGLVDFPGVTGKTGFDETGEVDKALPLLEIRGRSFYKIFTPAEGGRDLNSRPRFITN